MLDANLILNDVEQLLDGHYARWAGLAPRRVQVYATPPKAAAVEQPPPVVPTAKPTSTVNDLVASVFVLLVLSILNNKLAPRATRQ